MDNQHKKIAGYRNLSQIEIDLMNEIKAKGEEVRELVKKLEWHSSPEVDLDWLNIGKTDLQTGFMALVRSVAKPDSF